MISEARKALEKIGVTNINPAPVSYTHLCRAFGVQAITLQADVRSPEACQNLVEDTAAAFGRIDVLVNNAGITLSLIHI